MVNGEPAAGVLRRHLRGANRIALADGVGAPLSLFGPLTEAARASAPPSLLLGWCVAWSEELDLTAFSDVRSFMGGYAVRPSIAHGLVHYVPVRLGSVPAVLRGPLRPDVLVASVRPVAGGWSLGTEVGWIQSLVDAGVPVVAEVNHGMPAAAATPVMAPDRVVVAAEVDRSPAVVPDRPIPPQWRRIGQRVAKLVPEGATVQVGPGFVGQAVLSSLDVPVHCDAGVLIDGVVDLDRRALLLGTPSGAYLAGSRRLYDWADGRPLLRELEYTHDVSRLSQRPFVAVNTALRVDRAGQVNVEGIDGDVAGGIGGHADYSLAASRSGGMSIVALPTAWRGVPTLVERLSEPASTPRSDVDVVVTELGAADLRGLSDAERADALGEVWFPPAT